MSGQSLWAWGESDRFPPRDRRRALADRLENELGFPPLTVTEPTPLAEATLPEASLAVPDHLAAFCTADREARARHTYGKAYPDLLRAFQGRFEPAPDLVARPPDEAAIVDLLAWASDAGVAVGPVGGGTRGVGGIEPDLDRRGALDAGVSRGGSSGLVSPP